MQTFEFKVKSHNGMIKRPPKFQQWDERQIRVILLFEEIGSTIQIAVFSLTYGLSLQKLFYYLFNILFFIAFYRKLLNLIVEFYTLV